LKAKYSLIVTNRFRRSFKNVEKSVQERVFDILSELMEKPHAGTKLSGELSGLWRIRVGDYRIIYSINEKDKQVILIDVGHRKKIY
jgi:mRNA interferase RelE/StbE